MPNELKLAIIPARGGSKRIPGKNSKNFLGEPILSYSIKAAIESREFDEVMVSTDDQLIAKLALSYGAKVPFLRSSTNSNDKAIISDVLREVIAEYESMGTKFKYLCCIYPTAPFITSKKLQDSYEVMLKTKAGVVLPVVRFNYPVQRALLIDANDRVKLLQEEYRTTRSQDLPPIYHDAGQFLWLNVAAFKSSSQIFTDDVVPFVLNELEVQDIDTEEDWKIAEMKYQLIHA